MSSSKARDGKAPKRALPSWMSARGDGNENENENENESGNYKKDGAGEEEGSQKKARGRGAAVKDYDEDEEVARRGERSSAAGPSALNFDKLLDGVVFALSGFVNPERGTLRSQAMEMGAEYQPDWNSRCTLLVCAFRNTPKFRQVEADGGTIVSKDWITECYTQKMLVDIETYLMNIGKPWRRSNTARTGNQVHEKATPSKSHKQEVKRTEADHRCFSSKDKNAGSCQVSKENFSPSKVKKWALDDLNKTLTWLESQDEKPEPSELRNVAAEGILTCLQDAIDLLDKQQDLQQLTEQWNTVPRVVEELIKTQGSGNSSPPSSNKYLYEQALTCKKIYEGQLKGTSGNSNKPEEPQSKIRDKGKGKGKKSMSRHTTSSSVDYDSDDTIEMTEEEIDQAYSSIVSKMPGS